MPWGGSAHLGLCWELQGDWSLALGQEGSWSSFSFLFPNPPFPSLFPPPPHPPSAQSDLFVDLFVCSVSSFLRAGAKVNSQLRPCWKKDKFSTSRPEFLRFLLGSPCRGAYNNRVENLQVNQGFMLCLLDG